MAQRYQSQKSASRRRIDDNYNQLITQGYYQYGSQAHQVYAEPEVYDDDYEEVVRRKKPRKKSKKAEKIKVEFSLGQKKKTSFLTYSIAFIIAGSSIFCLTFMAINAQKKLQVTALKADLKEAQQNNYALQAEIYDGYDLADIENIATTKLKMMQPEEHQIVRVSIPEQSYIVQYENEAEEEKESFKLSLSGMYNMVFKD